jgi:hypothetical protein
VSKTYDRLTNFTSSNSPTLLGTIGTEATPSISGGSASVSSASAGTYTSFSSNSLILDNANYTLTGGTVSASITPKALNLTISKTADGSGTFTYANEYSLSGMVSGDSSPTLSSGHAFVSSANVASYSSFTSNSLALSNTNYTLTGGTVSATIHAGPPFISMAHSESASESANVHETNSIHADANDVSVDPVSGKILPHNERVVEALPFSTAIGAGIKMPAGFAVRYDRQAAR